MFGLRAPAPGRVWRFGWATAPLRGLRAAIRAVVRPAGCQQGRPDPATPPLGVPIACLLARGLCQHGLPFQGYCPRCGA